jgi:hypothetical protein
MYLSESMTSSVNFTISSYFRNISFMNMEIYVYTDLYQDKVDNACKLGDI